MNFLKTNLFKKMLSRISRTSRIIPKLVLKPVTYQVVSRKTFCNDAKISKILKMMEEEKKEKERREYQKLKSYRDGKEFFAFFCVFSSLCMWLAVKPGNYP